MTTSQRLALDFGGTSLKYALVAGAETVTESHCIPSPNKSRDEFLQTIRSIYSTYERQTDGVAISFAGCVNAQTGFVHHGGSYSFIMREDLKTELETLLGCPVAIANDAECALLGERSGGNLRDVDNAVVLVLGTAIGGALMLNGELYHGAHDNAGELSSYLYDVGGTGCERYWFMHNSAMGLFGPYATAHGIDPRKYSGRLFFQDLDEEKTNHIERFANELADVVYSIQTLLDVERFLVGGGISEHPELIEAIQAACALRFEEHSMFRVAQPDVQKCARGNDANLIGASVHFDRIAGRRRLS